MALISLKEYAEKNGINLRSARKKAAAGTLPAMKIGNNWVIEENTPYIDGRVKSGKYKNWRKDDKKMSKFEKVKEYEKFTFIQDAGFEFDFSDKKNPYYDDFENFRIGENRRHDVIDSFYDGDVDICKDEKGELYGVYFAINKNDVFAPCVWQKLKKIEKK